MVFISPIDISPNSERGRVDSLHGLVLFPWVLLEKSSLCSTRSSRHKKKAEPFLMKKRRKLFE